MRVFFAYVVPLLLPTVLYLLWLRFAAVDGHEREVPWLWLGAAGVALAAVVLVGLALSSGSKDGVYVPPHVENGRVVPGHTIPANP
jgi:ABC-type uncharacterized transport system YnjBCD permease subunit